MKIRRRSPNDPTPMPRFKLPRFPRARPGSGTGSSGERLWPESQTAPVGNPDGNPPDPDRIESTEGYQEGYRQGYEAGLQEGHEKGFQEGAKQIEAELTAAIEEHFNSLLQALQTGAEAIDAERQKQAQQFETWLPRAVLLVSECVLQREIQTDKETLVSVIRDSLDELPDGEPVTVHLHPQDYERLAEQPPAVWNTAHLTFTPDESVTQGGAIVESGTQVIDARLESRLLEAARHLLFPQNGEES